MRWLCVLVMLVALVCCSQSQDSNGTAGTAGSGGTSPPPANVDQACRDWCANEPEGFSCHQGPPESVEGCYQDCLRDYQQETERECEDEWIAIKECQLALACEDLFGDCNSFEEQLDECGRLALNRDYCETNCPDLDIAECEEDTTECRQLVEERRAAALYCESACPDQDLSECIDEYLLTGSCTGGTGGVDGGTDAGTDGGEPTGACNNEGDLAVIEDGSRLQDATRDCSFAVCAGLAGDEDLSLFSRCVTNCITMTVPELSTECAACYGGIEQCGDEAFCRGRCQDDVCC